MKCHDFEKSIYLYRELKDDERELTDIHISGCESCRALFGLVSQQQNLIQTIATRKIQVREPQRLTRQIMNSIERNEKRVSPLNTVSSWLDNLFVKYAFTALSIVLLSFLYMEQQETTAVRPVADIHIRQGSVLNSNTFFKQHVKRRAQRATSLSISKYTYAKSDRLAKTL